jgi:hypothetical protein
LLALAATAAVGAGGCELLESRSLVLFRLSGQPGTPAIARLTISAYNRTVEHPGPLPEAGAPPLLAGVYLERDAPETISVDVVAFDARPRALARKRGDVRLQKGDQTFVDLILDKTCADACTRGAVRCGTRAVETCADHDEDGCTEWGGAQPCERKCANGVCLACSDECAAGSTRCNGAATAETCADHDRNGCTEWGGARMCPYGCANNNCRACLDQCVSGSARCNGVNAETCADRDRDGCTEWGLARSCPNGCSNGACLGAVGDPCVTTANCAAGLSCTTGGGWCTRPCTRDIDCPGANYCLMNTAGGMNCFPRCATNADCTKYGPGVTCKSFRTVSGATQTLCSA